MAGKTRRETPRGSSPRGGPRQHIIGRVPDGGQVIHQRARPVEDDVANHGRSVSAFLIQATESLKPEPIKVGMARQLRPVFGQTEQADFGADPPARPRPERLADGNKHFPITAVAETADRFGNDLDAQIKNIARQFDVIRLNLRAAGVRVAANRPRQPAARCRFFHRQKCVVHAHDYEARSVRPGPAGSRPASSLR